MIGYDLLNDRDLLSSVVDDSQYERHLKIKKKMDSKQAKRQAKISNKTTSDLLKSSINSGEF